MLKTYFETAWALLYWNIKKTVFRLKGRRGIAPCQHPSDSGLALQTGCLACGFWREPARFKKICPLLVDTPKGLKCSVDAKDVRPFWAPALVFYGKLATATALVALLATFATLRSVGYAINITDLVWPRYWHRIPEARSALLVKKARSLLEAGKVREGILFLQNAQEADPSNYAIGLDLAMLYRTTMPANADHQFERLMAYHPAERHATALLWLYSLVIHAQFGKIFALAAIQLKADPAHANPWAKALIVASRPLHATTELRKILSDPAKRLDPWRACLALEIALQEKNSREVDAQFRQRWTTDAPAYAKFHRLLAMAQNQRGIEALDLIREHENEIDPASKIILLLDTLSELKLPDRLATQVDLLLSRQASPDTIKMLCAHVIRYRDAATFRQAYVRAAALDPQAADASMWLSLFTAAGASKDALALREIAAKLRQRPVTAPLISAVQEFFDGNSERKTFTAFLPWLGLPLEENYAVLEHPPEPLRPAPK